VKSEDFFFQNALKWFVFPVLELEEILLLIEAPKTSHLWYLFFVGKAEKEEILDKDKVWQIR